MKTKVIIALVIAVAVALVVLFSDIYRPQKTLNNPALYNTVHTNELQYENVPPFLQRSFPNTDFSKRQPAIETAVSGGPQKDGIPAIDEPRFTSVSEFKRSDDVEAIVINDRDMVKVYPYNILTWHEIVNDTANGVPIAVTFCPLCGSAIVFDRRTDSGETTFGVSGALIESNMVMYDRLTESLWQQSTGKALTGKLHGTQLALFPFQLLTMGEVRSRYPEARVLSEDTGYNRDYGRNPYSGYNDNNDFVFQPSEFSDQFAPKEIMVVFRVDEQVVATPWLTLTNGTNRKTTVLGNTITIEKADDELRIIDETGTTYPFFFEMWFSVAVQNPDAIVVK